MKIFGLRIMTEGQYQWELKRRRNDGYLKAVQDHAEQVATLIMEKQVLQDKIDGVRILKNSYLNDRFETF